MLATAHILVDQGFDKLTTNRVAKVAGVSVGSLYQYFPNKKALVIALIQQHVDQAIELLRKTAVELASAPVADAVRSYVKNIMALHAEDPELHRVTTQLALSMGLEHIEEHHATLRSVVQAYLEAHQAEIRPTNLPLAAFMVVSIVEATIHSAFITPDHWPADDLEQEICAAVLRYLLD